MGYFSDEERGDHLDFKEESETSSNVDEREGHSGPVGQALPTTGSAFDHIDLSQITTPPALIAFAEGCCEEYRLSAIAKEDVMRTTSLPGANFMTIRLYARIMAMGQDATKTQTDDFLKSNTFKENIKRRLQGGLLDPNIPYYVRGCTAGFVRHMRENPASYEIPQMVQEGLMTTKRFSSAVGEILSGFRGELRRKIFGSIEDKTDISTTGEKLAIQGFQISEDHLKQFALLASNQLRQLCEDYIKAEAEAQAKKAVENAQAGARHRKRPSHFGPKRSELLKQILRQDRKRYPDHTKQARWFPPASKLIVSQWQAEASYAIRVIAGYTLTAAQEGQEALPIGPGVPKEESGLTNREDQPEEEDSTPGGDEGDWHTQDGTSTNGDLQEDSHNLSDNEMAHTSTHQPPEDRLPPDGPGTGSVHPRFGNDSPSNNGAPANHTPQRPTQGGPSDSVGPVRGTPGPQVGRVSTLAQTSRGSPFPSSSRKPAPQPLQTPTRSVTQRLQVGGQYNPVGSETVAASVGI